MVKDNFYYILKERLDYAREYLKDTSAHLQSINFQKKVKKEFYKDKFFLNFLVTIIYLPSSLIDYFEYQKSIFYYSKASKEVEILKQELRKYES